jgi:hypothetical protein
MRIALQVQGPILLVEQQDNSWFRHSRHFRSDEDSTLSAGHDSWLVRKKTKITGSMLVQGKEEMCDKHQGLSALLRQKVKEGIASDALAFQVNSYRTLLVSDIKHSVALFYELNLACQTGISFVKLFRLTLINDR